MPGEAADSFARLRASGAVLPDEALTIGDYFPWAAGTALGPSLVDGSAFSHLHEEHEPGVRAWLARSG